MTNVERNLKSYGKENLKNIKKRNYYKVKIELISKFKNLKVRHRCVKKVEMVNFKRG